MHPYPAMETMAHIARWLGIFSFCVSFIICLMVIAPLLAQARPGSSLWRPAWLCPLAALATFLLIHFLILLPAAHMDYRLMEVIDWWLPIHFAAMGGVAAFTFSYATLMHGWVKKIAAPQPYVD